MCVVVVVVHWHCSAQLSMFNMEKRYRNKIIIIIINQLSACSWRTCRLIIGPAVSIIRRLADELMSGLIGIWSAFGRHAIIGPRHRADMFAIHCYLRADIWPMSTC